MPTTLAIVLTVLATAARPAPAPAGAFRVLEGDGVRVVYAGDRLASSAERTAELVPRLVREQGTALGIEAPAGVTVSLAASQSDAGGARALGLEGMPSWAAGIARGSDFIAVRLDRLGTYPDRTLAAVLAHEVAHLMLDRALGTDRAANPPAWFDEGYAMTEAASYGGGHRYELGRSLVLAGPIPLARLDRWPDDAPGARAAYAQVHSFLSFVLDEAGGDAARAVVRRMRAGEGFHAAWRASTGAAPEEWARAWRRSVTFWYRWIPVATSGGTVWLLGSLLFVTAYVRRRRRARAILERWEEEERFQDPDIGDRWAGPPS